MSEPTVAISSAREPKLLDRGRGRAPLLLSPIRHRDAPDGSPSPTGQGRRPHLRPDHRARRQGRKRSGHRAVLPASLKADLMEHLKGVKWLHDEDLRAGNGRVHLPHALARKYPRAAAEWGWQYVFRRRRSPVTLVRESTGGITCTSGLYSAPFMMRRGRPASPRRRPATRCGTPSPRTCC